LEAELRDWIAIDDDDFAGNILRYGVGVSHDLWCSPCYSLKPVVELVGWTVVDGQVSTRQPTGLAAVESASGDTIVNAKLGVRLAGEQMDLYAGYGRALTGDVWYEDTVRLELRMFF
jgi:hypothetical protein